MHHKTDPLAGYKRQATPKDKSVRIPASPDEFIPQMNRNTLKFSFTYPIPGVNGILHFPVVQCGNQCFYCQLFQCNKHC